MVSFELHSGTEGALRFLKALKLFYLGESLGTVVSRINHPATMTHASIPEEVRLKNGISNGLLRLSIGCEDGEDLVDDLDQALNATKAETVCSDAADYGPNNDKQGLRLAF